MKCIVFARIVFYADEFNVLHKVGYIWPANWNVYKNVARKGIKYKAHETLRPPL